MRGSHRARRRRGWPRAGRRAPPADRAPRPPAWPPRRSPWGRCRRPWRQPRSAASAHLAVIRGAITPLITAKSDFDCLAAAVPAAVGAHDVGQLGLAALGADAAGRLGEAPGGRPPAAALGFRRLLLGDGHAFLRFLTQVDVVEGGPARVSSGGRTPARSLVEIGPARRADALTTGLAERGQG